MWAAHYKVGRMKLLIMTVNSLADGVVSPAVVPLYALCVLELDGDFFYEMSLLSHVSKQRNAKILFVIQITLQPFFRAFVPNPTYILKLFMIINNSE